MLFSIYMEIYIYGYIYICIDPFHWIKTFTLLFIPFNHSQQSVIDKYHYLNDLNITQKSLFYSEQNKFSHRFKDLSGVTQLLVVGLRFDPVSFTSGLNPYYKIPWWHETIFMFSKSIQSFSEHFSLLVWATWALCGRARSCTTTTLQIRKSGSQSLHHLNKNHMARK